MGPGIMEPPGPAIVGGKGQRIAGKNDWPLVRAVVGVPVIEIVELGLDCRAGRNVDVVSRGERNGRILGLRWSRLESRPGISRNGCQANDDGSVRSMEPGAVMFALTVISLPFPLSVMPAGTAAAVPPEPPGPGFVVEAMVKVSGAVGRGSVCDHPGPIIGGLRYPGDGNHFALGHAAGCCRGNRPMWCRWHLCPICCSPT